MLTKNIEQSKLRDEKKNEKKIKNKDDNVFSLDAYLCSS